MRGEIKNQIEMCQLGLDLFCKSKGLKSHTFKTPDSFETKKVYVEGLGLISAENS